MRPGFGLVVELVRGHTPATAAVSEWYEALDVARQERVLPLIVTAARAQSLPPEVREQMVAIEREITLGSFWWASELKGVLRGFAAAGLDVVLLKGPSLAERLYGETRGRECRDLDLLVRRRDTIAAEHLLASLGFAPYARADDYHRGWLRGATMVELHFDVENPLAIDFEVASAWERTLPSHFGGEPCRILAPADELLFLSLHGARHRYERLSLVMDMARGFATLGPATAPAAFQDAAPARLKHLLVLGAALARRIDPSLELPAGLVLDDGYRAQMEAIAAGLWRELEEGTSTPLDWRRQHAFFLELERTPLRRFAARLRLARILATRLIEEDFAFARGYGVHQPGMVWVLRQMRLIGRLLRSKSPPPVQ